MTDKLLQGPQEEQTVCITCGFCCDGTLFLHAVLNPGEKENLPAKIEQNSYTENEKDYFRLPCLYFSEKCTIYDRKRADVCSSYRCQLLKDFAEEKITLQNALETVREAIKTRTELTEQYQRISGKNTQINFRNLLLELGKMLESAMNEKMFSPDYDMLVTRCNIFEALLIKHFRSASDFEKMMTGEKPKD